MKRLKKRTLIVTVILGVAAMGCGLGWHFLPQLLPKDWLRARMAVELRRQLGREVAVEQLDMDWHRGITLRGLTIGQRGGSGADPLLRMGELAAPFDPWGLVWSHLDYVRIKQLDIHLFMDAQGKPLYVEDLPGIFKQPRPAFEIGDLRVQAVGVYLHRAEGSGPPLILDCPEIKAWQTPEGLQEWSLQLQQRGSAQSRIRFEGKEHYPEASNAATGKHLGVQCTIEDFDFKGLGLEPLLDRYLQTLLPEKEQRFSQLEGRLNLHHVLTITQAGDLKWSGQLNLEGLGLKVQNASGANLTLITPAAWRAQMQGRYDVASGTLDVQALQLAGPGLAGELTAHYHPQTDASEVLSLTLNDLRLRPEELLLTVPWLGQNRPWKFLVPVFEGELHLAGQVASGPRSQTIALTLDGTAWGVRSTAIIKPAGQPFTVAVEGRFQRDTGQVALSRGDFQWCGLHTTATGAIADIYPLSRLTNEADWPAVLCEVLSQADTRLQAQVDIEDVDRLLASAEHLTDYILPGMILHGPVTARIDTQGQSDLARLEIRGTLPAESELLVEDPRAEQLDVMLHKTRGKALAFSLAGRLPVTGIGLQNFQLQMQWDNGQMVLGPCQLTLPQGLLSRMPLDVSSDWKITECGAWLSLLPQLARAVQQSGLHLDGAMEGQLRFHQEAHQAQLSARFSLQAAALEGHIMLQAGLPPEAATADSPLELQAVDLRLEAQDLRRLTTVMPGYFNARKQVALGEVWVDQLQGSLLVQGQGRCQGEETLALEFSWDADQAGFQVSRRNDGVVLLAKLPDTPCRGQGSLELQPREAWGRLRSAGMPQMTSSPMCLSLKTLDVKLDNSFLKLNGDVQVNKKDAAVANAGMWECQKGQLQMEGVLCHDDRWCEGVKGVVSWPQAIVVQGKTHGHGQVNWDQPAGVFTAEGQVDLSPTRVVIHPMPPRNRDAILEKAVGQELSVALALKGDPNDPQVSIGPSQVHLAGNHLSWSGSVDLSVPPVALLHGQPLGVTAAALTTRLDMSDVASLASWWPSLRAYHLNGSCQLAVPVRWAMTPAPQLSAEPLSLELKLAGDIQGLPATLRATVPEISSTKVLIPAFQLNLGGNDLAMVLDLEQRDVSLSPTLMPWQGRIDINSNQLDLDALQRALAIDSQAPGVGDPNRFITLVDKHLPGALTFLRGCGLELSARLGHLVATDPATEARFNLVEVRANSILTEALLEGHFDASLNGGTFTGQFDCDLEGTDPVLNFKSTAQHLQADDNLRPLVETEFPGLVANGLIAETKSLAIPLRCLIHQSCGWAGTGTTVLTNGVIYGPGGPSWMLAVFPGLKLVEYNWQETTNRFTYLPTGVKENHMLFKGDLYDIYLDGISVEVRDPNEYRQAIEALRADRRALQEQLAKGPDLLDSSLKLRRMRYDLEGLEKQYQRYQAGQRLIVHRAEYTVGALLSPGSKKETFDKPSEWLRTPLFRAQSYIIGRNMIGQTTTNVSLSEISRESTLYRLIQGSIDKFK